LNVAKLIFIYFSTFSVLLPLGAIGYLKNNQDTISSNILKLGIASISADIISIILTQYKINNWPIANVFLFFQFIVFFNLIRGEKKYTLAFFICIFFSILDFLVIHSPLTFNSYSTYSSGLFLVILAIRYLLSALRDLKVEKVQSLPLFWLSFGILTYYGGTIFLFLFNNYLIKNMPKSYGSIWILHNMLNSLKYLFLLLTLWTNSRSRTLL